MPLKEGRKFRMEDDGINGELAGISNSSSKRNAEEMLEAKDRDIREKAANNGSKSEDETGGTLSRDQAGGRVIKNLITTLFHHPSDDGGGNGKADMEKEVESGSSERGNDKSASEEDNGGIIRSIVSHLPQSLPEDAVPTTDEASILIHSIIHD